jgi:hypothetical protein
MLACLLGEQNGEWTLSFCKKMCFGHLFWAGQPEWEGGMELTRQPSGQLG